MSVSDYNTDPNSNTSISGINIAEGCPPSGINNAIRQMMADIRAADDDNVKLSGNQTVGGVKTFTDWMKTKGFYQSASNGSAIVAGGAGVGANDGAKLTLYGKDEATDPGEFKLLAGNATAYKILNGAPDGTLTWDGKNIITDGGGQTIGGVKTFSEYIVGKGIHQTTNSGQLILGGGGNIAYQNGAKLTVYGASATDYPGEFRLLAGNASAYKQLIGNPDGTLTWDSKSFVYTSGDQELTGNITINRAQPYLYCKDTTYTRGSGKPSSGAYSGVFWKDSAGKDTARVIAEAYGNTGEKSFALLFQLHDPTSSTSSTTRQILFNWYGTPIYAFEPGSTDQNILLGRSSRKWHEIWCSQSSINSSSDERIKQAISAIPDDVLDAWGDVNWIQYKYNDAVKEKGLDKARLHNGLIAQRVDEAFKAHGLNAAQYGLFLYDEWESTPEQTDGDGNVTLPAQEAGDAYGLRYTEALAMEAAYQRRRADRAEARISALERRLDEMEAVLATLGA